MEDDDKITGTRLVPEEKPQAALVPSLPLTHLLLRGDLGSRVGPECHPLGGLFFASSLALLMLVAPVCVSVLPGIHLHAWHRCLWVTRLVSPTPTFFLHPLCRLLQDAPVLGPLPVTLLAPSKGVARAPAPCPITASPQSPPRSPQVTCLACVVTPSRSPGRNHTVPCLAVCTGPPLWVGCFLVVGAASRGLRLPVVQPRLATPAHCSPRHTTACSIRDRASCLGFVSWDIFPFEPSVLVPLGSSCRVTA